jgi:hypothetical protein
MHMPKACPYLILGFILVGCPLDVRAIDRALPTAIKLPAEDRKFADLARTLQARYWTFDEIFAALCRAALTNAQAKGVNSPHSTPCRPDQRVISLQSKGVTH